MDGQMESMVAVRATPKKLVCIPGQQVVDTISAAFGGHAEGVLRQLARSKGGIDVGLDRKFSPWIETGKRTFETTGTIFLIQPNGQKIEREFTLVIGAQRGLFLKDDLARSWYSLKPVEPNVLVIGDLSRRSGLSPVRDLNKIEQRCLHVANNIAACVFRGRNWASRASGDDSQSSLAVYPEPYGEVACVRPYRPYVPSPRESRAYDRYHSIW